MANEIIREYAKASDVKLWQIAEAMGITDQWLSRKLRNELTETETDRIMGLIDEVRNTKAQRGLRKPPLKRCNWSEGWTCIKELCVRRNCLVEIGYNPDDPHTPYCVQFGGSGHYFKTLDGAYSYCEGRHWCSSSTRMRECNYGE